MSSGSIIAIIGAILFVVVGLPVLSCVGCIGYTRYKANQFITEVEAELEQAEAEEQQRQLIQQQAINNMLSDRLYPIAKGHITQHWTEPGEVRRRAFTDWTARKIDEQTYEVYGDLELTYREGGSQQFKWACQYSTFSNPTDVNASWTLERITMNGAAVYP